jgi:hypothetical protein
MMILMAGLVVPIRVALGASLRGADGKAAGA